MNEILATSTDGRLRVSLERDTDAHTPDGDGYGHVFRIEGTTVDLLGTDYGADGEASSMRHAIVDVLHRFGHDLELVKRYLTMFHGVVAFDYIPRGYGEIVGVVTREMATAWGCDPDTVTPNLEDWEAWADGDVYGYVIEERVHMSGQTSTGRGYVLERECWELVDWEGASVWGHYGADYAESAALEAWGEFLEEQGATAA